MLTRSQSCFGEQDSCSVKQDWKPRNAITKLQQTCFYHRPKYLKHDQKRDHKVTTNLFFRSSQISETRSQSYNKLVFTTGPNFWNMIRNVREDIISDQKKYSKWILLIESRKLVTATKKVLKWVLPRSPGPSYKMPCRSYLGASGKHLLITHLEYSNNLKNFWLNLVLPDDIRTEKFRQAPP